MGKKIVGIILIVCALFNAFLGIKAAGNAPGNQASLSLSPLLTGKALRLRIRKAVAGFLNSSLFAIKCIL